MCNKFPEFYYFIQIFESNCINICTEVKYSTQIYISYVCEVIKLQV